MASIWSGPLIWRQRCCTGAGPLSGTSSSSLGFVGSQLSLSLHGWLGPASSGWSAPPGRCLAVLPTMKKPRRRGATRGLLRVYCAREGNLAPRVTVLAEGGCCLIDCHALQDIARRGLRSYCPDDGRPHTKVSPSLRRASFCYAIHGHCGGGS
jgi:hypothetical protein